MAGILDFLKKPGVQDALVTGGAAAAFGPVALLAYPFLRDDRKRSAVELDLAREQVIGARGKNESDRLSREAAQSFPKLLGPITPEELSVNPITGQPLSAPDPGNLPGAQDARQIKLLSAAAAMAPGAVGGALVNRAMPTQRETKPPALIALADYIKSASPELNQMQALEEAARLQSAGKTDPNQALETENLLNQLALQRESLQNSIEERRTATEQQAAAEQTQAWKLEDSAVNIQEMTHALDVLEDSPLRPGFFFNDMVKGGFDIAQLGADALSPGSDASKWLEKQRTAYSDFDKNSKLFVRNYLDAFIASGGTVTRDIQRLTEESSANKSLNVDTIKTINALTAKDILRRDEGNEVKISAGDRRQLEALVGQWKKGHKGESPDFASEREAQTAVNAGLIKDGAKVMINGREARVYAD